MGLWVVVIVAFDIDGTLTRSPFDPSRLRMAEPNRPVIRTLRMLRRAGTKIIVVTARPERYKDDTIAWLRGQAIPYDRLVMRQTGDNRDDPVLRADQSRGAVLLFDDKAENCAQSPIRCVRVQG